jgi:hypothetical protein
MRGGVIMAVRFAVAMAIFLWPISAWPQDAAKSDPNTPLSPQAQARKNFVDEIGRKYEKIITKRHTGEPASTLSAEGPDATYYVWRTFAGQWADASQCKGNEIVAARLRKLGFTKLVVIDERGGRCELDPVTRAVSVTEPANLPPGTDWAEGTVQGHFGPSIEQKVDARSDPAKVTGEEARALTTKSYVLIGTIHAWRPGNKGDAQATQEIEAAILKKAAEAGGDVVRFSTEGEEGTVAVPTGKTETVKTCLEKKMEPGPTTITKSCIATSAGPQCSSTWTGSQVERCVKWGTEEVPITTTENRLSSEGTVWRYDSNRAADTAPPADQPAQPIASAPPNAANADATLDRLEKLAAQGVAKDLRQKSDEAMKDAMDDMRAIAGVSLEPAAKPDTTVPPPPAEQATRKAAEPPPQTQEVSPAAAASPQPAAAEVNAKDDNRDQPLCDAARLGKKDVAELLLAQGIDVNTRKCYIGDTPLIDAADTGKKEVAELLLAHGADVNARDDWGDTALLLTAGAGYGDVVELLLAHGADVNAKDKYGTTPLRAALRNHHPDIADLLRQHGGHK